MKQKYYLVFGLLLLSAIVGLIFLYLQKPIINNGNTSNNQSVVEKEKALAISLYSNHEDSTILINLNLNNFQDFSLYSSLGFIVYKENGVEYHPTEDPVFVEGSNIAGPLQQKTYSKVITHLKPDSEYEICLTGMYKDYTATGYFYCEKIRTEPKKSEYALVAVNYDVDENSTKLINDWIIFVRNKNPSITISTYKIEEGTTPEELLTKFKLDYSSNNLNYIVLIGQDLPVPEVDIGEGRLHLASPYTSLSYVNRGEFLNEDGNGANEVTIAIIRPENKNGITKYFERLINYYKGNLNYSKKILLADAMMPSEKSIVRSDFEKYGYSEQDIDYVTGINSYSDVSEAYKWKNEYSNYLLNKRYGLLVIIAHGSRTTHYPCDSSSCVDSNLIKQTNPKALMIIGISCNIGNFMTPGSPMVSYVFDGESLAGLGAETPFWDANAIAAKLIFKRLAEEKKTIGEVGRRFGFVIIGDPFLKL